MPFLGRNYIESLGLSQLPIISASPKDSMVGASQGRTFRGELSRNDYVCHHPGKTSVMPQLPSRVFTTKVVLHPYLRDLAVSFWSEVPASVSSAWVAFGLYGSASLVVELE